MASSSFFLRILAREKAETLGSPLTSGSEVTGVCVCGVEAASVFWEVADSVVISEFSTLDAGFSALTE
ncbi:hypothetical protein [Flavobacterium fluviatile]|uniref:hypothetical protein n=1 Tax=Flavobacterium fluviatile TaxID=1862387 RepID=UPI0013D09A78|nr:hypothetical protein [Flavobacterium fluviatile]